MNGLEQAVQIMGREPLNPLGTCFDAAGLNFIHSVTEPDDRLVHAIGVANMPGEEGIEIGHAWIEFTKNGERLAFDAIWGVVMQAARYRQQLRAHNIIEYSKEQVMRLWSATNVPGPWDAEIIAVIDRARGLRLPTSSQS